MNLFYCYALLVQILRVLVASDNEGQCAYTKRDKAPEVYYVNMDKSTSRKVSTEKHLDEMGLRHHRVRGMLPSEIFVPPDIERTFDNARCMSSTEWVPPDKLSVSYNHTASEHVNHTAYTAALCGRGKGRKGWGGNTAKELGCTAAHLVAIHRAVYSTTAKSRYALIVEDDVFFPFDIDYDAMVASAPKGFGILQLFNSNIHSMRASWELYTGNYDTIWLKRHPKKYRDFWSTCAYLIDRTVMKPVIDSVAQKYNGWWQFKIIAGVSSPCVPKACCRQGGGKGEGEIGNFINKPPCVWAPRGYQADSILYAMTTTFTLSMPIITNGIGGNVSTFHQKHVGWVHRDSFRQQRGYVNAMLDGRIPPPKFVKPACTNLLDENLL